MRTCFRLKPLLLAAVLLSVAGAISTRAVAAGGTQWPQDVRVVVTVSFDVDGETLWWDDPASQSGRPGPVSQGSYGPRVALPKILALLDELDMPASFFVPSWVAERYPDMLPAIVAGGHEIGAHGVLHESPTSLSPEEELRRLRHSVDVLSRLSGARPRGYRAPAWAPSEATLALVAAEGFLYSSNLMDADLPYVHDQPAGLVELPVSWVLDDAPHFWFELDSWDKTIRSSAEVEVLWREEFTAAYEEGGYFGLTLHPQIIGRPARLRMLESLLVWIRGHDGVWVATCGEVAEWVRRRE